MQDPAKQTSPFGTTRTRLGFTLIELMIVVAIMGVLAAIAIPSLQKSVRRSRTTEALLGLRKIFDGSVAYYDRDHTTADGQIVEAQFPGTVSITPFHAGESNPPAGVKRAPREGDWDHPTWRVLNFGVSDPYYYVYQYESDRTGDQAFFWINAHGDLDGDGILSVFRRGGTIHDGSVRGSGGIYRGNPSE